MGWFCKSISETQASLLKQLISAKSECKLAPAPETDPKPASPQNQDMPKVKQEQNGEKKKIMSPFKYETQVEKCKKQGCPMKKQTMGTSYEAAQLIKRQHVTCLKKKKFDDSEDRESNVKVMSKESNGAETSTDSEEKSTRKSSRPIKIPLVKDNREEGPQILPLDSPKKKKKK